MQQPPKQRPPAHLGLPTESQKIACRRLPCNSSFEAAYPAQIVESIQHRMGTPKSSKHCRQPAGNQPRGQITVWIHLHHGAPKAPLAHLPISKTKQQRPDHRTHGVLKVGNQLDRKQRKRHSASSAQKARNGNPLLLKARKQLNGIAPVRRNLPIAMKSSTDRAQRPKVGYEINPAGQKRFRVLPNRLKSVNVGKLNLRLPCSPGGRSSGCQTIGPASLEGLVILPRSIPYLTFPTAVISSVQLSCKFPLTLPSQYRGK